jgi:hypothetical protein
VVVVLFGPALGYRRAVGGHARRPARERKERGTDVLFGDYKPTGKLASVSSMAQSWSTWATPITIPVQVRLRPDLLSTE